MGLLKRINIFPSYYHEHFLNKHNEPDSVHIISSILVKSDSVEFTSSSNQHTFQKNLGPTFGPTAKHWWEGTTALIPGFLVHSR